ncbi:unnamed protein product, partial [Brenthis ino]
MFLYAFIITFLAIALTALYHRYNRTTRLINKIPGPAGWPIIGNSLKYALPSDKLFAYQRYLPKKYGELSQIHGLDIRIVNVTNPNDIEKILSSTEYNYKEHPYTYLTKWLRQGLLISNGNKWFQRRRMLTKTFHFNILKKFTKSFIEESEEFMKLIEKEVGKEQTDVLEMISNATLRILCDTAMGFSDHDNMQSSIDSYLDGLRVIGQCIGNRLAKGHDTTAVAMTFMVMTLANEPEIQDKIYAEMQQIFGDSDRSPTSQDLSDMKYLECCIKESMRLYPSAPLIMRYLTKDTVLSGYTIPAQTTCCICIYDVHRRDDSFPEPERFIPERFLPENISTRHPFSYIPFSAGYRNCIGQKFALLEMKVMMSGLIRKFRLEPVTKTSDLIFITDLVLRTESPVYVKFSSRK